MNKSSLKIVEALLQNWYFEYRDLNYSAIFPYKVISYGDLYFSVEIRPTVDVNFCSSLLVEKVVQIAKSVCLNFYLSYEKGLVFTLH